MSGHPDTSHPSNTPALAAAMDKRRRKLAVWFARERARDHGALIDACAATALFAHLDSRPPANPVVPDDSPGDSTDFATSLLTPS